MLQCWRMFLFSGFKLFLHEESLRVLCNYIEKNNALYFFHDHWFKSKIRSDFRTNQGHFRRQDIFLDKVDLRIIFNCDTGTLVELFAFLYKRQIHQPGCHIITATLEPVLLDNAKMYLKVFGQCKLLSILHTTRLLYVGRR